jgi:N-acetylmuramoyl-L-alanine amidase
MRRFSLTLLALLFLSTPSLAAPKVICIDPGHGGSDPGAVGCGLEEEDVTLDVAWLLHGLLEADPDLSPVLTRTGDTTVSLGARCNYANDQGAARFASIHCNAFNGSATGIETFCYANGSAASFDQRNRIQDWMTETWPKLTDRGGKTANYYVLKNTSMPATLSELAFIDNCAIDAPYLANSTSLQAAAVAHHQALRESLGLAPKNVDPVTPPAGTGVLRGIIFEDVGVGMEDMSIRLAGAWVEISGEGEYEAVATGAPYGDFMVPLPSGTYSVMASKEGYESNTRTCTVKSGEETWCSLGLFKKPGQQPTANGILTGIIFEDLGNGSSDMSKRLPYTKVLIDNKKGAADQAVTAPPDAVFLFNVPPGLYEVTAIREGFWTNTRTCEVFSNQETWCSIGLFEQAEEETPPEPPATGGTLLGAIYAAKAMDDVDMSNRLPGARVTVDGNGLHQEVLAGAPYGMYSFGLPSGTYTVTASLEGYWPNSRTCAVAKGIEVWCSVGLLKIGGDGFGGGDEPVTPVDPPGGEVTPEDPGSEPVGPDGKPLVVGKDELAEDSGCGIAGRGSPSGLLMVLLALLVLGLGRWGRRSGLAVLLLVATVALSPAAEPAGSGGPTLTEVRLVSSGAGFEQPLLSPDGQWLACAGEHFTELHVLPAAGGSGRLVATGTSAGYEPVWSATGERLFWRLPGQKRNELPAQAVTRDGAPGDPPENRTPGRWVRVVDDEVFLRTGAVERLLSVPGDRYYGAALSGDGARVLFHGLEGGVWVHDASKGRSYSLGAGTNARFGPSSATLVFDRCQDDGKVLTSCELLLVDLSGSEPTVRPIAGTPPLARQPSLGPDGLLAFEADGSLYVGRLVP